MMKYLNFYTKNELAHILFPEYPGRYAWKKLAAMLSDEPSLAPLLQSKRRYISIREMQLIINKLDPNRIVV